MNEIKAVMPPSFRNLGWSNLQAQCAEQMALAAAPLAAVIILNAGPAETGWLQTAQTIPFLLLSIPAGVLADRVSKKYLLVGSELIKAFSLIAILILLITSNLSLLALAALGFVGAIETVCYSVAAPALVPVIVPRPLLSEANRLLELARSVAYAAGPAIGGAIVGWSGPTIAFTFAAILSLSAVSFLGRVSEPVRTNIVKNRRNILQEINEGAIFTFTNDLLRPVVITSILFNVSWFVLQSIYIAYAVSNLGMTPTIVGITLGIYGAGMVLGALLARSLSARVPFGLLIVIGPIGGLIGAVVMLATLWQGGILLPCISFFLFGAGPIIWTISTTTLRQAITPGHMLGRVSAMIMTATFGARPIGAAIGAVVAGRFGVEICLYVAALGFLAQFLVIALSSVPRLERLPEAV
jgi:MFS family permease